jgi:hypothetical protein
VGSERKPLQLKTAGDALSALISKLSGEPAEQLLKTAAIARLHDRAGGLPSSPDRELPPQCPVDPRPRCGARAAWHLRSMLAGSFGAVLPEWLAAIAAAGQRVPEELVPPLLKSAARQHGELVLQAVGPLATWLDMPIGQLKPLPGTVAVDWETATVQERVALLDDLRRRDAAAAIEKIESTWAVDKADHRKEFVRTLQHGLGLADEPFLERTLEDKSVVVRRVAADLLARIPASALVQRVASTAKDCVVVVKKGMLLNRKNALEVRLLAELPPALVRDGVEAKGAPQGIGERAWWTQQAIGLAPPSLCSEWLNLSAESLVEAAGNGDDAKLLMTAWAHAALRHRDVAWARALLLRATAPENQTRELFLLLTPTDRETVALASDERLPFVVGSCQHEWSLNFTRQVLQKLAELPAHSMREFGRFASLTFLDEIPAGASPGLLELAAILRFRREMHQAIRDRQ